MSALSRSQPSPADPSGSSRADKSASVARKSPHTSQNVSLGRRQNTSFSIPNKSIRAVRRSSSQKSLELSSGPQKSSVTSSVPELGSNTTVFGAVAGDEGSPEDVINNINIEELLEIRSFAEPPAVVKRTLQLTCIILNAACVKTPKAEPAWAEVKARVANGSFLDEIRNYDMATLYDAPAVVEFVKSTYFSESEPLTFTRVQRASRAAAALFRWSAKAVESVDVAPNFVEEPRWWVCENCGEENKLSRQGCNNCGTEKKVVGLRPLRRVK